MAEIKPFPNQSLDIILKIFRKKCEKSGILKDLKKKNFYEKPSIKKKEKSKAARKRTKMQMKKMGMF